MNQLTAEGIVLSRLNYGEADRIIKLITPEAGKISLIARGVRKSKSKLAGAIELFSVSSLTYIRGRGDLGTLVSARLEQHYGNVVKQIERVQLGYDLIKILDRATEDEAEAGYFKLLQNTFIALNDISIETPIIRFWFTAQLLQLAGFAPNLHTDIGGNKLEPETAYGFDFDNVCFAQNNAGKFKADHIKLLRLGFADSSPRLLGQITNITELLPVVMPLTQTMLSTYIRI